MKDGVTAAEKPKQATTGNGAAPDFAAWFNGYNQALEIWAQASADLVKGAAELSQEIMTFSQSRFQAGVDAWQTAVACRTPADLFESQRELAEKATIAPLREEDDHAQSRKYMRADRTSDPME